MEIIVNTRLLLPDKLEGIGWFEYETLKRITRNHPEDHFIFLFDRDFSEEFIFSENITPLIISPQARHPFLYYWWFEFSVAGVLNKLKPDLFLSPDGYLSLRSACRQLPVMHDINFEHYPKDIPFLEQQYYHRFFPRFAQKATRIATVSEYSKKDIAEQYTVEPGRIDVVYNGCSSVFKPITETQRSATKKKYSKGADYFLFIGALHPRKNISMLLKAFDQFRKTQSSDLKLLIVGKKYYWTSEIKHTYLDMEFREEVIFTGRLDPEALAAVTASALALTYVPYFEGFGVPILEAMNSDTPVITSNVTSMPEVAADAALFVDPFSVDSICNAMLYLWKDEDMRKSLVEKGRKRKLDFSWDRTADLLWKSILKSVEEGK